MMHQEGDLMQTMTVDEHQIDEFFFARNWTDGLPVVAPTVAAVDRLLGHVELDGAAPLGTIASRGVTLTAATLAANAVMAGVRPEFFPVVLAAIECLFDPAFNVDAALTSTGGAALCVIVSGPLADKIGLNGGHNALGAGFRANATIGRTLRLVAMNAFDARPGGMDGSSLGNPGKYSLCFAESTPPPSWNPLRVELGYGVDDTTVTLVATEAPRQVANHLNGEADGILATFVSAMRSPTTFICGKGGQAVIVIGPEHALALAEGGLQPSDVRTALATRTRIDPAELAAAGILVPVGSQHDMTPGTDGLLPVVRSAADVLLVTAGGAGAGWSAYLPSWASSLATRMVTRRVREPGEQLPDCGPDACDIPSALGV
jgi:hypothetical protein